MDAVRHRTILSLTLSLLAGLALAQPAHALRIKDLCEVQGARGNTLTGIGLVVGLAGTGDKTNDSIRRQERMLDRLDIEIEGIRELSSANVAVVAVTATVPAFAKEGTRIDVHVSSIYDCESLEGGTLMETLLAGIDKRFYAVAQGPVSVGGFNAEGGGGTGVRKNHVTAGGIPMGAYIEREIPSTITDGERITLLLKRPEFILADRIRQAVDLHCGTDAATALGAGTVNIRIPPERRHDLVAFIAGLQELEVETDQPNACVVVNERTGTIVVGGDVMIKPCQVAHGNLTIQIATTPVVSQPSPFGLGETVQSEVVDVGVTEEEAFLMPVQGTSAADVAATLNKLKVTPRDMIAIFQALRRAGALEADLDIM
ncbi:MAG: flagellar basal body P-ring protein FlgI [Candidatus Hydrogenedentes bacterium]|nr:flagellar basal body P-ring protein FlgI [Candidatus Hydrogenedentota bacterium]